MFIEDDDDFDLVGGTPAPTDEDDVEETEEVEEEAEEAEKEPEEEVEQPDEEVQEKPKDNKTQALSAERARRKAAEKELKELKAKLDAEKLAKTQEDRVAKEREAYKKKILEGDLVDEEVAEKLLDVFGDDIIKNKIATQTRLEAEDFEQKLSELKKDELFMDADVYKPQIKELMDKGLSMEEAYFASVGKSRFTQMKKDMEVELEQKLLNNNRKADEIDIGHAEEKGVVKRGSYTKREQEIAKETGLPVAEVHKRSGMFSIEDLENL
jgi:multidrug efflux pump subunit AcrA (membrane-fusion protein)